LRDLPHGNEFRGSAFRVHHRAVHRIGDERLVERRRIEPLKVARKLWSSGSAERPAALDPAAPRVPW